MNRLFRVGVLKPLAERDFAFLTAGSFVSQLGDGFFFVALAWQVYEISNVPTAMSLVGLAWTLPLILFVLIGGVFSDRYDRRWLMVGADLLRAAAIGLLGILSISGSLEIWHVIVLIAFVGIGDAFFNPASTAIVPDLVDEELLPQANALGSLVRPLTGRLIGPAIGGFTVARGGVGGRVRGGCGELPGVGGGGRGHPPPACGAAMSSTASGRPFTRWARASPTSGPSPGSGPPW